MMSLLLLFRLYPSPLCEGEPLRWGQHLMREFT